jgi:hypothetical protein
VSLWSLRAFRDPAPFVAVTTTMKVNPRSSLVVRYVGPLACGTQLAPLEHRSHAKAKSVGLPVHAPACAVSSEPYTLFPEIRGEAVFRGRALAAVLVEPVRVDPVLVDPVLVVPVLVVPVLVVPVLVVPVLVVPVLVEPVLVEPPPAPTGGGGGGGAEVPPLPALPPEPLGDHTPPAHGLSAPDPVPVAVRVTGPRAPWITIWRGWMTSGTRWSGSGIVAGAKPARPGTVVDPGARSSAAARADAPVASWPRLCDSAKAVPATPVPHAVAQATIASFPPNRGIIAAQLVPVAGPLPPPPATTAGPDQPVLMV